MKNNELPLVTAIITTHNRKDLLPRAIESVRKQTYPNIELIVVDDASTDGTKEMCEDKDFRYIYIPQEESKGGNHARNIGIAAASGEFVCFCDDDDYWLPEKTAREYEVLKETGTEIAHCSRRVETVWSNGSVSYTDQYLTEAHQGDLSNRIFFQITLITSAMMVSKSLLDAVGGFDENLGFWQEYELSMRLAQQSDVVLVNEPLYVYRINQQDPARLTNKYFEWRKAVKYIHEKHSKAYKQLTFKDNLRAKKLVESDAIGRAYSSGLRWRGLYHRLNLKMLQLIGL